MPVRTLNPEGYGLWGPTSIGEGNECERGRWALKDSGLRELTSVGENEAIFIKGVETSP